MDPRFVDAAIRDYHLRGDSPAIDAGCDQDYAPQNDVDGDGRYIGFAPDLGADEYPLFLTIGKTGPLTAKTGEPITYTLTITNAGQQDAANLIVADTIPTGANYVSGGDSAGGGVVSWTIPTLAVSESITVQCVLTAAQTILNNDYRVSLDDGYSVRGKIAVVTFVSPSGGLPNLTISKIGPTSANAGDPITYTLTTMNSGDADAIGLLITDTLPTGANYVSGGTLNGNEVQWTVSKLAANSSISAQFTITALHNAVNADYRVLAMGGLSATGSLTAATKINDCPRLPNAICVLDENGQPAPGALVYRNGQLVTDVYGNLRLTDNQGAMTFAALYAGETLAALQLAYEQPTNKVAHNPTGSENFAFRVYRTSMIVGDDGAVDLYVAPASDQPHTLTLHPHNTLVLFNVLASVEWDASDDEGEYVEQLEFGLEEASRMLYDATDGQMALGWITIYDNAEHWNDADIQIRTHNHTWPHAFIGGITTNDAQRLIYKGIAPEPGKIVLGRYWDGNGAVHGPWNEPEGYATITHEFGHYALFLFDEYFYYAGSGNYRLRLPSRCSYNMHDPASLMFYQYTKPEFCNRPEHYPEYYGGPPTRQTQVYGSDESSWITIQGVYSDVLQAMSGDSPTWAIISPLERGVDFVLGPAQPPLDWLDMRDETSNTGAFTIKPINVKYGGSPIWGALVSLHKVNGAVLDQGLTDRQGRIDILGAGPGDTIRVRTPENSLAGSLIVWDATPETINLAPVFGGQSGNLRVQDTITHSTPLITIVPQADGTTIDYFMYQTGQLSNTVCANILGAQSPPIAAKTMSYDADEERYFVDFTGYSTGTLAGLTLQVTATVNLSGFIEIGITHDRGWTEGGPNELDLTSTDGNLILNAPGGSFDSSTYVIVNPTNAQPSPPPEDKVIIGQPYSIQASGALSNSQQPMALNLAYQSLSLGQVDEMTLRPYYWATITGEWVPVISYTVNITANQVSGSVDLFGIYALMGNTPAPQVDSITPMTATVPACLCLRSSKETVSRTGRRFA